MRGASSGQRPESGDIVGGRDRERTARLEREFGHLAPVRPVCRVQEGPAARRGLEPGPENIRVERAEEERQVAGGRNGPHGLPEAVGIARGRPHRDRVEAEVAPDVVVREIRGRPDALGELVRREGVVDGHRAGRRVVVGELVPLDHVLAPDRDRGGAVADPHRPHGGREQGLELAEVPGVLRAEERRAGLEGQLPVDEPSRERHAVRLAALGAVRPGQKPIDLDRARLGDRALRHQASPPSRAVTQSFARPSATSASGHEQSASIARRRAPIAAGWDIMKMSTPASRSESAVSASQSGPRRLGAPVRRRHRHPGLACGPGVGRARDGRVLELGVAHQGRVPRPLVDRERVLEAVPERDRGQVHHDPLGRQVLVEPAVQLLRIVQFEAREREEVVAVYRGGPRDLLEGLGRRHLERDRVQEEPFAGGHRRDLGEDVRVLPGVAASPDDKGDVHGLEHALDRGRSLARARILDQRIRREEVDRDGLRPEPVDVQARPFGRVVPDLLERGPKGLRHRHAGIEDVHRDDRAVHYRPVEEREGRGLGTADGERPRPRPSLSPGRAEHDLADPARVLGPLGHELGREQLGRPLGTSLSRRKPERGRRERAERQTELELVELEAEPLELDPPRRPEHGEELRPDRPDEVPAVHERSPRGRGSAGSSRSMITRSA